jgi:tRNA (guanosine-2'-O-)-methyltransferase
MDRRRFERMRSALERRQPDLTLLLENVHKSHNLGAVVRTCDAVGVLEVHAVWPKPQRLSVLATAGVRRFVGVRSHENLAAALRHLRAQRLQLVAAHPAPEAVDFRAVDYTRPTALLLGQERDGLTSEARAAAGTIISIPMAGLGASLNVSVAAALILFEAQRQRAEAGLYNECRLEPELFARTLFEWAYPRFAALCRRRGVPYPRLSEEGEILDPLPR